MPSAHVSPFAGMADEYAIHRLKRFQPRRSWMNDDTHACCNLSGSWTMAGPRLASSYASTALIEGEVYDADLQGFPLLARKSKPWAWQRNGSVPDLLVFRQEQEPALPTADAIDWAEALRGRVVLFVGDSLGSYQAINLLHLVSNRREHSIESSSRHFAPTSGESMHQPSWCRAVCAKVRGGWSRTNRCREVRTVVCWLSAGKSESPSMVRRTLALVTTWAFGSLPSLTRRDIVVANYGHHFAPWATDNRMLSRQLETFVEACRWHASGRWRREVDPDDEAAAASEGMKGWRRRVPHTFYREASPQFWAEGVFPGRVGTSSKRHDCLPPWEYAVVQRAQRTRQHQLETCGPSQAQRQPHSQTKTATSGAVAGTAPSGGSKLTLERLLGARAFAAYNAGGCDAVAASPVSLLHTWLPSALLGSRESSVAGDCTHSYMLGSTNAFYNQALMHTVWRRERRLADRSAAAASGAALGAAPVQLTGRSHANRLDTWLELKEMLALANDNVATRDRARDGAYGAICGKYGRQNGTYRPFPLACCTEASPVQKCAHTAHGFSIWPPPRMLQNSRGKVVPARAG